MKQGRYIRQTSLKEFGPQAQQKLQAARVLIVGLGGLGIPVAQYLNAMGVGTLGLVEQDTVALHNLQRQVLFTEKDVGRPKLEVALDFLREQNSGTELLGYDTFLNRQNALSILGGFDVIVDATDNFPTRYLINDACVILDTPFVYGALHNFEGQVSVFNYKGGPTYRCLFPAMPGPGEIPDCDTNGVLGVLPGIIGNLQALETVKIITGIGTPLAGQLLLYDALGQAVQKMRFPLVPENLGISQLQPDYGDTLCGTTAGVSIEALLELIGSQRNPWILDVREPEEFNEYHIPDSVNIPLKDLESLPQELQAGTYYVICATGKRSRAAVQWIREHMRHIVALNVEGGIEKYRALCP